MRVEGRLELTNLLGSSLIRSKLVAGVLKGRTCRFTFTFKLPMKRLTFLWPGFLWSGSNGRGGGREEALAEARAPLRAEVSPADTAERTVLVILGRDD